MIMILKKQILPLLLGFMLAFSINVNSNFCQKILYNQ